MTFPRVWPLAILFLSISLCTVGSVDGGVADINSVMPELRSPIGAYPNSNLIFNDNLSSLASVSFFEDQMGTPEPGTSFFANSHQAWFSSDGGLSAHPFTNQEGFRISFDLNLDTNNVSPRKEAGILFTQQTVGTGRLHVTSDNGGIATFGSYFPFTLNLFDDGDGAEYGGTPYNVGDNVSVEIVYSPGLGSLMNGDLTVPATLEFIVNGISSGERTLNNFENGVVDGTHIGLYLQNEVPTAQANDSFTSATFSNIRVIPEPSSLTLSVLGALGIMRKYYLRTGKRDSTKNSV